MITKEKNLEKICSFYASEYHLEMIMIPYINRKIDEKSKVIIITEKDLTKTVNTVISRVNLPKERKKEILDINWESESTNNINIVKDNQELVIFVVGTSEYINKINKQIEKTSTQTNIKIINCYSIEEVQNNITEIVIKHSKVLNTTEEKEIN